MRRIIEERSLTYQPEQKVAWEAAHSKWWPNCSDASVWGEFAAQAACGRYVFSRRNQPKYHFGETFVGREWENRGYTCWTGVELIRPPGRGMHSDLGDLTRQLESQMKETTGLVPQEQYFECHKNGLRLKNIDLVGFHPGRRHWAFIEVKVDNDKLHPKQKKTLEFLRQLFTPEQADVLVVSVRQQRDRAHPE